MLDTSKIISANSQDTWSHQTIQKKKLMSSERLLSRYLRFSNISKESLAEIHRNVKNVRDDLRYHSFWDDTWGRRVFRGKVASLEEIQGFLYASPLWDKKTERWRYIPHEPDSEQDLHIPFVELISTVLGYFGDFENRSVHLTHKDIAFDPTTSEEQELFKLVPDITIMGTGANFSSSGTPGSGILSSAYVNCVSPIEVSTSQRTSQDFEHYLVQMGHYARQCFIEQDNRKFVYTLLLNERYVHICTFDRSGSHSSSAIDIHLKPRLLVRLILGICSPNDSMVGFDTDVFWNTDKTRRFIATVDQNEEQVCYELVDTRPVFSSRSLRGVGTRFWSAKDANGKKLLIKDSWHTKGNIPEEGFLEAAEEFVAVGSMVASQQGDLVSSIRDFARDAIPSHPENVFWDRVFSRTTFEDGSTLLCKISTSRDFLLNVRNVIEGNQSLCEGGLLYRRVNLNNFIVGEKENPAGEPGMIDMNLSFWLNRSTSLLGVQVKAGSPAFLSINELMNGDQEKGFNKHDHIDDIESIFYALCWVTIGNVNLQDEVSPFPSCLNDWGNSDLKIAAYSKQAVLLLDEFLPARQVTSFFGPVFQHLLRQIHTFLRPRIARKLISANFDIVQPVISTAVVDYATILGFIDEALEELCILDERRPEMVQPHVDTSYVSATVASTSRKRSALELDRFSEARANGKKRPKIYANGSPSSLPQQRRC